ncbi:hypothetical protein PCL_07799 [Purpureocillium lilacinum]|uniref:Uncharacterized protein n=1 Tax=Purpureocillium lilacinum TaxID=33203 RepID=A0A2U3EIY2_PURLI|nr:hypothetical protein PCL_07799 [Purpureocillium lilacinum]
MKASIITFALIQGLALATPVKQPNNQGLKQAQDLQKLYIGGPKSSAELVREHQRKILPRECFREDKISPLCDNMYFTCAFDNLGRDFIEKYYSEKKIMMFTACIMGNFRMSNFKGSGPKGNM